MPMQPLHALASQITREHQQDEQEYQEIERMYARVREFPVVEGNSDQSEEQI